jgi:hypothetical protein
MSQYQTTKLPRLFIVAAWCALGFIIFVTLSPIGLRPGTGSAGLERFVAYYLLGSVFVAAYPRHFTLVMMFILTVAISLELLQHLTPDRHGRVADAVEKIAGGIAGCSLARLIQILLPKSSSKP